MPHNLHGHLIYDRPLEDLGTVLDMMGLSSNLDGEVLLAETVGVRLTLKPSPSNKILIEGQIDEQEPDPDTFCHHLALALEADGTNFELHLSDSAGQDVGHYGPAS